MSDTETTNTNQETTDSQATLDTVAAMDDDEREMEQKMIKVISGMPDKVQTRFKALHMLSDERSKINDEFELEVSALEQKFRDRRQPMLKQRREILNGETTEFGELIPAFDENIVKLETIVAGIVKTDEEKKADEEAAEKHTPTDVSHLKEVQGVPDFWSVAIKNNQMMMQAIREKDQDTLQYISDITVTKEEKPDKELTLVMTFRENEYFKNKDLTLKLRYKDDQQVKETIGTAIEWNDGKDLTKKKIKKKQKHKKSGETRTIVKTVPAESFYNVFESKIAPEDADESDPDSETEKLLDGLDESLQIGEDMYDLYMSDALEYYLDLAENLDFLGGGEDDSDDSGSDNSDDGKKKKSTPSETPSSSTSKDSEKPEGGDQKKEQECKQQ